MLLSVSLLEDPALTRWYLLSQRALPWNKMTAEKVWVWQELKRLSGAIGGLVASCHSRCRCLCACHSSVWDDVLVPCLTACVWLQWPLLTTTEEWGEEWGRDGGERRSRGKQGKRSQKKTRYQIDKMRTWRITTAEVYSSSALTCLHLSVCLKHSICLSVCLWALLDREHRCVWASVWVGVCEIPDRSGWELVAGWFVEVGTREEQSK